METNHVKNAAGHSRRGFLKFSTAASVSLAGAAAPSLSEAQPARARKLRIGAMCVGDGSFWTYSWGDLLAPGEKPINQATLGTGVLNMEVTHVWDINAPAAGKFAAQMGAKTVRRYDGMVGQVDAVAIGGFYEIPWQHRLARPYIDAGIPTYLGRPFAYSLRDIDTLLDLAAKRNTPVIATDLYEHLYSVQTLRARSANVGDIECVHATVLTADYPMRFHVQFMLPKIFGFDIRRVALFTDDPNQSTYLVGNYLYPGKEGRPPFPCSVSMTPRGDLYSFSIIGTKGIESERLPQIPEWRNDLMTHHLPLMIDMQRTFQGASYEPLDLVRKKTELFLTGFYSATERGGAPVDVGAVPTGWRARPARPDWVSEAVFK
jgi:hypothetical protein